MFYFYFKEEENLGETDTSLIDILGEDDYQELQLKSLVNKVDKGEFMPSLHSWLKQVAPATGS